MEQNTRQRAVPPRLTLAKTPDQAWSQIVTSIGPEDFVCVAGSAFLVAELRPAIVGWLRR